MSKFKKTMQTMDKENRDMLAETPTTLSKLLGVANIHASHCGELKGLIPMLPRRLLDLEFETELIGETQIVDSQGHVIARRLASQGAGVITADIELNKQAPSLLLPDRYWIPEMKLGTKVHWWQQNYVSKSIYRRARKEGRLAACPEFL